MSAILKIDFHKHKIVYFATRHPKHTHTSKANGKSVFSAHLKFSARIFGQKHIVFVAARFAVRNFPYHY
jgi:hypothetical protein